VISVAGLDCSAMRHPIVLTPAVVPTYPWNAIENKTGDHFCWSRS